MFKFSACVPYEMYAPYRENTPMDITNPKLLYAKGGLFLLGGTLAAAGVILEAPNWRVALLLALTVWCFARAYYFAFYVVEHYIDPGYRYAGLWSFVQYSLRRWRRSR